MNPDNVIMYVKYAFEITCPRCGRVNDLSDDDDGAVTIPIFNNKWDKVKGCIHQCDNCKNLLAIEDVLT